MKPKKYNIQLHESSQKHQDASKPFHFSSQPTLKFNSQTNKLHTCEARTSLFIAKHSSINTVEHLVHLMKENDPDSDVVTNIRLARTKCSKIISNVWEPVLRSQLKNNIGQNGLYSLIIDESNDISDMKMLGVVIIYYSKIKEEIVTTFLQLVELTTCDSDGIIAGIKEVLQIFELKIENMRGLGTDNASVMVGINNGVFKKLQQENPKIVLIPCICHSLQLAVSDAAKHNLPRSVEYMISETYNWFSRSAIRQNEYRQLYKLINENHDPLKIVQQSKTRWLSISSAVDRIVDQYDELLTHFGIAKTRERCLTAEYLNTMYCDKTNLAMLLFLRPILNDINRVNKIFESRESNFCLLFDQIIFLVQSLAKKISNQHPNFDPLKSKLENFLLPSPYLGYNFEQKVLQLRSNGEISDQCEKDLRSRCINFLIALLYQIRQRLPDNIQILRNIAIFSPENSLNQRKGPLIPILRHFKINEKNLEQIEEEWNNISLLKWNNTDLTKFWIEIYNKKNATGDRPFERLSEFVLSLLILPISNSEVERVFSQMNLIKTKTRNKMQLRMLNSILSIRAAMVRDKKCCYNFPIPQAVLSLIGKSDKYDTTENTNDENVNSILQALTENDDPECGCF